MRRTKHCRRFYASQFSAQISSASCLELKSVQSSMMLAGFPSDIQQIFKLAEVTKSIRISVQSTSSPWQLFTHSPALKALRSSRCWKIVLGLIANYIIEIRAQKKHINSNSMKTTFKFHWVVVLRRCVAYRASLSSLWMQFFFMNDCMCVAEVVGELSPVEGEKVIDRSI